MDFIPLPYKNLSPLAMEVYRVLSQAGVALGDYTQPMTTEQINAGRTFRLTPRIEPYVPSAPIDDGPNPGEMELDWLAINREFS